MRHLGWQSAALVVLGGWAAQAQAQVGVNTYGDIGYSVRDDGTTSTNSFAVPRLDLFLTAEQDRTTFLAETLFEVNEQNEFAVDVERIEVGYLVAGWLRLRAGRFHTALGYFNDAYHHGHYFQTTIDRPRMVEFEDGGGFIPAHSVGIHADGRIPIGGAGSIRYDLDLANGRGQAPDEVTNLIDHNKSKAFNARLRFEPAFLEGLIIGGNIYLDNIPTSMAIPTKISERIYGAHVAYLENHVHLIGEFMHIEHRMADMKTTVDGGFAELGYAIASVTPYFRFEGASIPDALDPFYALNPIAVNGSFAAFTGGLRYEVSDHLVLKVEGDLFRPKRGDDVRRLAFECAFAY